MGEQRVSNLNNEKHKQLFVKSLLNDVKALEYMLDNDWFESGIVRIGAEQEMVLVNKETYKPMLNAMELLEIMKKDTWVETELAKFNLEINLDPKVLAGNCFSALEKETSAKLSKIQKQLDKLGTSIILTGILPTLQKKDLDICNLTPKKRYAALMEAINEQLIGNGYQLRISGIDELLIKHDSPLLEACNTSFQVHLQVEPKDFVTYYNIAQTLAGPTLAIASNSPIVFGKRLWHESRIALFQQSLDTRATHEHMRERSPRVNFGKEWLKESILEIYKEDIAQFRPLICPDITEDSLALIQDGAVPKLTALQVHNSTIYRWNRPCYGISDSGKPHLRIENRVLPSGPTVVDEVANACFWIGAMKGMVEEYGDVTKLLSFADVRDNFAKAAQFGIDTTFNWIGDKKISACDLILKELLPLARRGLEKYKIKKADIDLYLGIIEGRAKQHTNGARWQLRAYSQLCSETSADEALTVLTHAIINNQRENLPVHKWKPPKLSDLKEYKPSNLKVSEFMDTDLLTVNKDDILDFAIDLMEWRTIRYLPVEDKEGHLVGLISSKQILKHLSSVKKKAKKIVTVKDIMIDHPATISPDGTIMEAMKLMKAKKVGCLPVVLGQELVGVITENHFMKITNRLMERLQIEINEK